ncbi:MAG: hypothetical protein Ta2E_00050 [Mycoplasmoidaceae bacterium]|nr:MAG: hypothetical protein Ta2E_00050 [Mycoplasmoidaceae bacterium]
MSVPVFHLMVYKRIKTLIKLYQETIQKQNENENQPGYKLNLSDKVKLIQKEENVEENKIQ